MISVARLRYLYHIGPEPPQSRQSSANARDDRFARRAAACDPFILRPTGGRLVPAAGTSSGGDAACPYLKSNHNWIRPGTMARRGPRSLDWFAGCGRAGSPPIRPGHGRSHRWQSTSDTEAFHPPVVMWAGPRTAKIGTADRGRPLDDGDVRVAGVVELDTGSAGRDPGRPADIVGQGAAGRLRPARRMGHRTGGQHSRYWSPTPNSSDGQDAQPGCHRHHCQS